MEFTYCYSLDSGQFRTGRILGLALTMQPGSVEMSVH